MPLQSRVPEQVYLLFKGASFNQPKLCPNATWDLAAVTFADNSTVGTKPQTIFIDADNTVYTADFENGSIHIWTEGSTIPTGTILTNYTQPRALFVSMAGRVLRDRLFSSRSRSRPAEVEPVPIPIPVKLRSGSRSRSRCQKLKPVPIPYDPENLSNHYCRVKKTMVYGCFLNNSSIVKARELRFSLMDRRHFSTSFHKRTLF